MSPFVRPFDVDRRDPDEPTNWTFTCKHCGADFSWDANSDVVELGEIKEEHFDKEHPGEKLAFNLRWVGDGPPPRSKPKFAR